MVWSFQIFLPDRKVVAKLDCYTRKLVCSLQWKETCNYLEVFLYWNYIMSNSLFLGWKKKFLLIFSKVYSEVKNCHIGYLSEMQLPNPYLPELK